MAGRPPKQTVDYFPHYVNASSRKTLLILEQEYGAVGYAFWFKLLELLGRTPRHYYTFPNQEELMALAAATKASLDDTKEMLAMLARLGAIDAELLSVRCIWAVNLVANVAYAYDKREGDPPAKPTRQQVIEEYKAVGVKVFPDTDMAFPAPEIGNTGTEKGINGYFQDNNGISGREGKGRELIEENRREEEGDESPREGLDERYRYRSDGRQPLTQADIDNNPSGKWRCVGFTDKVTWDFVCDVKDLKGKCGDPIVGCVCAEPAGVET